MCLACQLVSIESGGVMVSSAIIGVSAPVLVVLCIAGAGSAVPFGACGATVCVAGLCVVLTSWLSDMAPGQRCGVGSSVDIGRLLGLKPKLGGLLWNHGLAGRSERAISTCRALMSWSNSPSFPCHFHCCWFRQLGW